MSEGYQARGEAADRMGNEREVHRGRRKRRFSPGRPKNWAPPTHSIAEGAKRLVEARRGAGYETATAAAKALGVKIITYQHHESGRRALTPQVAALYAAKFGVSPTFLMYGASLQPAKRVPIVGIIGARGFVHMLRSGEQTTTVPPPPTDPETILVPLSVDGSDLWPAYHDGDTVWFDPEDLSRPIDEQLIRGRDCVLQLTDGRRVVRRVVHVVYSDAAGAHYATLGLYSSEEVLNVPISGAARIKWRSLRE